MPTVNHRQTTLLAKAKRSYYNKLLCNSSNKILTTWKILKPETGRTNKTKV
jgi:hypothetical protein